ncbi:hypothetical protein H5410_036621 [Solanum commersonii]|uniref:Uncharacterized protein n=1 Tax=Solanum commersonii TaxID=4109 RepID=A0A9J5Y5D4_SOLCO|nr:hypothetical protein H5410_036621 [Solanum commersonii]
MARDPWTIARRRSAGVLCFLCRHSAVPFLSRASALARPPLPLVCKDARGHFTATHRRLRSYRSLRLLTNGV